MSAKRHILHVDDDPSIREIVKVMLETLGEFEVTSVDGGAPALEVVAERPPDLVLLDVMMPDMDGPETLLRMREMANGAGLPVVFLTAKVMRGDMERLEGLDPEAIIQKPFRAADLVVALRRILDRREHGG